MALQMGPTASIILRTDSKELRVGLAFWHEASRQAHVAEFLDNPGLALNILKLSQLNSRASKIVSLKHSPFPCRTTEFQRHRQVRCACPWSLWKKNHTKYDFVFVENTLFSLILDYKKLTE